jgi:hypothetical protein
MSFDSECSPHDNVSKSPRFINKVCRDGHVASLLVVGGPHVTSYGHPRFNSSHVLNGFLPLYLILIKDVLPAKNIKPLEMH